MNTPDRSANWHAEVSKYLREHNIASALGENQIPLGVIGVWKCDEQAIRQLAKELTEWVGENDTVQIFGLDQMLEGRQPEVASYLFCIPMMIGSSDPRTWTQQVALVACAKNNHESEAKLGASLFQLVKRHAPAWADSYDAYCYQSR